MQGHVSTNGIENFWSLLKRGLNGAYVSVEPFHLFRYLDEQMFRYNNRGTRKHKIADADRFNLVLSQVAGKRLTYEQVTGKVGETAFYPYRGKRGRKPKIKPQHSLASGSSPLAVGLLFGQAERILRLSKDV